MSSYHPIHDVWILARAKLKGGRKYYGAYLGGFPERARAVVGAGITEPVLHVCGGMARYYPYPAGYGPADQTLDLDPACEPDFLQDARDPWPQPAGFPTGRTNYLWRAILCDPPYSEADAAKYVPGAAAYPSPNLLAKNAMAVLPIGGRVGVLHYLWTACPKNARSIFVAGVLCGFNNRIRCFSVFEKVSD